MRIRIRRSSSARKPLRDMKSVISARRRLTIFTLALLLAGCAGPRTQLMTGVRNDLRAANYPKAYHDYQKKVAGTDAVDKLLNLGLLAFEAGDYAKAQQALADADRLAEERLTKSLSREAAALATSDRVRAYQGTVVDRAMIHYYRALAFVATGDGSAATVEGRKVAQYLEVNARESKHSYKDDAFLQYFSGALYDGFGQTNDAWISYKRAHEIYQDYYGTGEPDFICPLAAMTAKAVGAPADQIENCPPGQTEYKQGNGRVVIVCEAGQAPPILEQNITFPIMKSDPVRWDNDDDRDRYSHDIYGRQGAEYHYQETELRYLLRVALPYYPDDYLGTHVTDVRVRDEAGLDVRADLGEPVGTILRKDLSDRMPAITVRAITRAIIKYAAKEAAESAAGKKDKDVGKLVGFLVNAAGALTEAADTRSWETLPERIFVADLSLPPGEHTLRALFQDDMGGTLERHDFPTVNVKAGEITFLRVRCEK
jgi:uncharacterized protein